MVEFIRKYINIQEIWFSEALRDRMNHYYRLIKHNPEENAFYLIVKSIPAEFSPDDTIEELWKKHRELKHYFESNIDTLIHSSLDRTRFPEVSFIDLKIEISKRMLLKCNFCEINCGKNRLNGELGFCGVGNESFYSSAFLHYGEESPLIPSGTIFFTGCNFGCVFCQNNDLSRAGKDFPLSHSGIKTSAKKLAEIATDLSKKGAININWVGGDPIPNLHNIIGSLQFQEMNNCQLWNSNFYNSSQSLNLLSDLIDVWLPDFKYGNNECALRFSKISRYWDILCRNLKFIGSHGSKNIIIRHLVMPGHIECCSKRILRWIAQNLKDRAVINIMKQYRPENEVNSRKYKEINRKPTNSELKSVFDYAESLGLEFRSVS